MIVCVKEYLNNNLGITIENQDVLDYLIYNMDKYIDDRMLDYGMKRNGEDSYKKCNCCDKDKHLINYMNECKDFKDFNRLHLAFIGKTCNTCRQIDNWSYYRCVRDPFIQRSWNGIKQRCRAFKRTNSFKSKEDYSNWAYDNNFEEIWDGYRKSGFKSDFAPSPDRLDTNKGYLKSNLQLVTWKENRENNFEMLRNCEYPGMKQFKDRKKKKKLIVNFT